MGRRFESVLGHHRPPLLHAGHLGARRGDVDPWARPIGFGTASRRTARVGRLPKRHRLTEANETARDRRHYCLRYGRDSVELPANLRHAAGKGDVLRTGHAGERVPRSEFRPECPRMPQARRRLSKLRNIHAVGHAPVDRRGWMPYGRDRGDVLECIRGTLRWRTPDRGPRLQITGLHGADGGSVTSTKMRQDPWTASPCARPCSLSWPGNPRCSMGIANRPASTPGSTDSTLRTGLAMRGCPTKAKDR